MKGCLLVLLSIQCLCAAAGTHGLRFAKPSADMIEGWERESVPIGCGWFGANVFGLVGSERVQITHNAFLTKKAPGRAYCNLTNAQELRFDFPHAAADVSGYERGLLFDEATAWVKYAVGGVTYRREFFASYPDKVLGVRLTADQAGKLSFAVRTETPSVAPFVAEGGKYGHGCHAQTSVSAATLDVDQQLEHFGVVYASRLRVETDGKVTAEKDRLRVDGAAWANVYFTCETNYKIGPQAFLEPDPQKKLSGSPLPRPEVERRIAAAQAKGYAAVRADHVRDFAALYGRVDLDLGGTDADRARFTPELKAIVAKGGRSAYLEETYFQYGRYLLASCSRPGTLPANLQGCWTGHVDTPWGAGYWHNINVQMNYWPSFSCNLAECFEAYADFNAAFRPAARALAREFLTKWVPDALPAEGESPDLWCVGVTVYPYELQGIPGGSSGPGMGGFTTKMFADWWDFTRDRGLLETRIWPVMRGMGDFLLRCTRDYGGKRLSVFSASPEMQLACERWSEHTAYYQTVGCAFDQQMIDEAVRDTLDVAAALGRDDKVVAALRAANGTFDPVQVGWSGQVKEYREENYYGEIGMYRHRHVSQLVGLMPGTVITRQTPAWLDAAKKTLDERGDYATGWALAHRFCLRARAFDGDHAYALYRTLITEKCFDNLWDTHPPFQIDGNFGGTAGVAEMLLQSHAGGVDLLPALPKAWAKRGSFRGLCARGGFTVDCTWEDGKVTQYELKGGSGEKPPVRLPEPVAAIAAPGGFHLDRATMTLRWTPSSAADVTYDVLRSRSGAATYETLATGLSACTYRDATARMQDEDVIVYKIVPRLNGVAGPALVHACSNASDLYKQRYLNFLRAKGGKEKGAPWIPSTEAPPRDFKDLD